MIRARRGGPAVIAVLMVGLAAPCGAQGGGSFLPLDHWSVRALQRLHDLGLVDGFDPNSRALPVGEALFQLDAAIARAEPPFLAQAELYRGWLADEVGAGEADTRRAEGWKEILLGGPTMAHARVSQAFAAEQGGLRPGIGGYEEDDWTGPQSVPTVSELRFRAEGGAAFGPLAGRASIHTFGTEVAVEEAYGMATAGPVSVWLGRRPWGYEDGAGGGMVLDSIRIDGGGLALRPVDVPLIGALGFETTASRIGDNGWIGRPWFWSMRLSLEPHPRFGLGLTRAAMFGGEGNAWVTADQLFKVLLGKHAIRGSGFENQLAALDVRWRPPLPVPAVLRLEWGFEDTAGAISEQPAILAGIDVPAVPGVPEVGLGVEYTYFRGLSLGHWVWYRHWWFHEGWTDNGVHLGHPLGGDGTEWRLYGSADLPGPGIRVGAHTFVRDRGTYNIYAPDREGRSGGLLAELDWRFNRQLELTGELSWEEGTDWREWGARIGVRWFGGVVRQ